MCKCIICEKEIRTGYPGDDSKGRLPSLHKAGNVVIHFGFGSKFDQGEFTSAEKQIQAFVCDNCFEQKILLTREVYIQRNVQYIVKN